MSEAPERITTEPTEYPLFEGRPYHRTRVKRDVDGRHYLRVEGYEVGDLPYLIRQDVNIHDQPLYMDLKGDKGEDSQRQG